MQRAAAKVTPMKTAATQAGPNAEAKQALIARLRRIEGQLRGIQGMIEREEGCEQVLQQMAAARKALERAFFATVACAYEVEACAEKADESVIRKLHEVSDLLVKYG